MCVGGCMHVWGGVGGERWMGVYSVTLSLLPTLKVDTVKRLCIKKLPKVLVIQLKRFDYDWERCVRALWTHVTRIC